MTQTEQQTTANTLANALAGVPPASSAVKPPRTGTKMAALPPMNAASQLPVQRLVQQLMSPPAQQASAAPAAPAGRTPVRPALKAGSLPFGTPLLEGDLRRTMPTPVARAIKARRVSFGANQIKSIPARGDVEPEVVVPVRAAPAASASPAAVASPKQPETGASQPPLENSSAFFSPVCEAVPEQNLKTLVASPKPAIGTGALSPGAAAAIALDAAAPISAAAAAQGGTYIAPQIVSEQRKDPTTSPLAASPETEVTSGISECHRAALSAMLMDMHAAVQSRVSEVKCEASDSVQASHVVMPPCEGASPHAEVSSVPTTTPSYALSGSKRNAAEFMEDTSSLPPLSTQTPSSADGLVRRHTRFDEETGAIVGFERTVIEHITELAETDVAAHDESMMPSKRTHTKFDEETGDVESVSVIPTAQSTAAMQDDGEAEIVEDEFYGDEDANAEQYAFEEGEEAAGDDVALGIICGKHIFFLSPEGVPLPVSSASSAAASDPQWDSVYGISADAETDSESDECPVQVLFPRTSAPTPLRQQIQARGLLVDIRKRRRTVGATNTTETATKHASECNPQPADVTSTDEAVQPRKGLPTPIRNSIAARKVSSAVKAAATEAAEPEPEAASAVEASDDEMSQVPPDLAPAQPEEVVVEKERSPYLEQWAEGDSDPKYRRGRESVLFGPSDSPDRRLSTVYEQVNT